MPSVTIVDFVGLMDHETSEAYHPVSPLLSYTDPGNLKEMEVIDHIILTVSDIKRSLAFYEACLAPLNLKFFLPYKGENGHPDLWGFGDGTRACLWLKQGGPEPKAIHWGFKADSNAQVDAFYQAAMAAGARDNISPRARVEYYSGYYAADVLDPDGYSFEVVHKS